MKNMAEIRRINFQKIVDSYSNQDELAEILGITPGYISQLVTGYRNMGEKTARKFENLLKIPTYSLDLIDDLNYIDGEVIRPLLAIHETLINIEPGPALKSRVPLINYIQAGHWSEIKDHFEPLEWIDTTLKASINTFALRVIGDSMTNPFGAPSIPEGFIVIIDPEIQAKHGSIVVARLENSNEAMIKQLIIDGPHRYLKPLNPNYRTIEITENCVICGVARKVEYDL